MGSFDDCSWLETSGWSTFPFVSGIFTICFFPAHTLIFKAILFVPHSNSRCKLFVLLAICFQAQSSVLCLTSWKAPGTSCWDREEILGRWVNREGAIYNLCGLVAVLQIRPTQSPFLSATKPSWSQAECASPVQGYCVTFVFMVLWPLEGSIRISVWEKMPWTDGKAAVIHRHIDKACRPTGCWPRPAVPSFSSRVFERKKEAEFQVTLPAHEFLLGVDIEWPFYHSLSYPWQGWHLHCLRSTTIHSLHQEAANSSFF